MSVLSVSRFPFLLLCAALVAVSLPAHSQQYPAKPIRLIIPTAAGGGPDTIGRAIAQKLTDDFGQTVVVDNRPGASGAIAMDLGRLAAPDGYTLNIFSVSQVIRPLLFRVAYDLARDFTPISQLSAQSYVLMTTPSLPVKSVSELIAYARANPGKLNYASVGQGSQIHLLTELFRSMTKIEVVHVPYKGIAAAYPDLFAGSIHFTFAGIISAQPHVKAQRVRALAVSGPKRMKALPDLPTVSEAGVPGFAVTQWYRTARARRDTAPDRRVPQQAGERRAPASGDGRPHRRRRFGGGGHDARSARRPHQIRAREMGEGDQGSGNQGRGLTFTRLSSSPISRSVSSFHATVSTASAARRPSTGAASARNLLSISASVSGRIACPLK